MKCFNHAEADAAGMCKYCARGLCHACIAERPSGIACRDRCEAQVDAIGHLVQRNIHLTASAPYNAAIIAAVFLVSAAVMAWLAWSEHEQTIHIVFLVLAALLSVVGLATLRTALMRRKKETS